MNSDLVRILEKSDSTISRVTTKSAINSMLWLAGLISLPCFVLSALVSAPIQYIFIGIGCIPLLIAAFSYIYLLLQNPDYLRSEDFHIQKYSMELLGEKGSEFDATAEHIVSISKPTRLLQAPTGEEDR
jgi:hypothetical protein